VKTALKIGASLVALLCANGAYAQSGGGNLKTLEGMHSTGPITELPLIPQTGPKADAIKKSLAQIKLPQGFHIGLYAVVPDARHMAVGPQGVVTFVGTRKTKVYAITDRTHTGVAEEVKEFAPSIPKAVPNGVCFSRDGFLFTVEQNRVLTFPAAEFFYENPDVAVGEVIKQGELIPKEEESFNHTARVCRVGPDNKLYISLGQPYNVPPHEKQDLYTKWGIGGIIRVDRPRSGRTSASHGMAAATRRTRSTRTTRPPPTSSSRRSSGRRTRRIWA
jgi:glucose/arabinose dehydrogenase